MKKLSSTFGKIIAVMLSGLCMTASISGCGYESVDDYLEQLGMKDPSDKPDEPARQVSVFYETQFPEISGSDSAKASSKDAAKESSAQQSTEASSDAAKETSSSSETVTDTEALEAPSDDIVFFSAYKDAGSSDFSDTVKAERAAVGLTDSGIEELKRQQEGLYAYERLTDAGKTLYVELLAILQNAASDVTVSTLSNDSLELVYDYVMADHPEIFYVDGYQYTDYSVGDSINRITFSGNYLYDIDEIQRRRTLINEAVNRIIAQAPSSDDDYYAIKYVYDYIIANTEYDMSADDNQNICSVFLGKRSVCNGYSKAAQYLLNKMGIKCTLVSGTVNTRTSKGERHAWNLVRCNNAYYYMDVTWGDASYQSVNGESADATKLPEVNYAFLNVTSEEIGRNHFASDQIYMPVCNSLTDNYYVREGEYFTSAELSLVGDLFNRRYSEGANNVTIKCANSDVYDALFNELITSRRVFDYLQEDNLQVSYTTFQDTRTIIFWI